MMRLHSVLCKLALLLGLSFFSDGLLSSKNLPRASCTRKLSSEFASLRAETTSNVSNKKQPKSPKRTSKVEPNPRSTAVFALMEGGKRKPTFAIRRLENDPDYLNLVDGRDRSFARLMLTTSERRQGQIDKVIRKFVHQSKQLKNRETDLLCEATLRIGAAQLLFMDVPPYAAVHETVEVLRMHPKIKVSKPQINFVNAVLRSIDREGLEELEKNTTVFDNVEPWLVQEWIDSYGDDTTKAIIEASMVQSPIFLSVNHETGSTEEERQAKLESIQKEFSDANSQAELLPHGSIRVPSGVVGAVSRWPMYDEGEWWVQDPSATLPAIALYNAVCTNDQAAQDLHVVDLCSAPGGKTAQLCSLGFGKVTAVEVSSRRTKPLMDNLQRLKMEGVCEVTVADGREWKPGNDDQIQGVLVDAPCSATGLGSRRPDVLRKAPDLDDLTTVQRELAAHTADVLLQPGGIMVYATCSLLKQESEDQMNWLLSRSDGADMETVPFLLGEIPGFDDAIDANGWLRVIPGTLPGSLASCDGFFVARLRRVR